MSEEDEEEKDDKEGQKWSGMIPISISMRPEEVCSIDSPEPYSFSSRDSRV